MSTEFCLLQRGQRSTAVFAVGVGVNSGSTSERWQLLTSFLATVHPEKLKVRPNRKTDIWR